MKLSEYVAPVKRDHPAEVERFLDEAVVFVEGGVVEGAPLFLAYAAWAVARGDQPMPRTVFGRIAGGWITRRNEWRTGRTQYVNIALKA
jgi:hypothetical protein